MNTIKVKGLCFEDLIAILTTNGYDVVVYANATHNACENTYTILYTQHCEEIGNGDEED